MVFLIWKIHINRHQAESIKKSLTMILLFEFVLIIFYWSQFKPQRDSLFLIQQDVLGTMK